MAADPPSKKVAFDKVGPKDGVNDVTEQPVEGFLKILNTKLLITIIMAGFELSVCVILKSNVTISLTSVVDTRKP